MAGACGCESGRGKVCEELPSKGMRLRAGKRQPWNCGGFGRFEGFEGGQMAALSAVKNRWLERVAARVAVEKLAKGWKSCRRKVCGRNWKV